MVTLEEKRAEIKRSEDRIDYFTRMLTERPRLFGVWRYWLHWYRMRRVAWLTHVWLQQVRAWKSEVKRWERQGQEFDLERAKVIEEKLKAIEDEMGAVERDEAETEEIARTRNWRIRYPHPHRTMVSWIAAKRRRLTRIRYWIAEIRREIRPPPKKELNRVSLNLYLIVEAGEREYPRKPGAYYVYRKPRPRRVRVKRKYPKGAFQSWLECDAFLDPETREILQEEEPFPTLLSLMRGEVAREFEEEFSLSRVDSDTLTLGEVSEIARPEEIGKPPYKIRVERTVEAKPRESWSTPVEAYLLTDEEYDRLTETMAQYRKHLEMMMT